MRGPLVWALVGLLAVVPMSLAHGFNLSERDKQLHIGASCGITAASYYGLKHLNASHRVALWSSVMISLTAGMIKEIRDSKPSDEDLKADLFGTGLGILVPVWQYGW